MMTEISKEAHPLTGDSVLSLGLHPSAVDLTQHPELTQEMLEARIEAGEAAIRQAGFDIVPCLVTADLDQAEKRVRECLAVRPVQVVMIGAGLRMAAEHTLLFERILNLLNELVPGVVFCFNTSPETTLDALRRWARPSH
ncbi:hypothetical protein QFZ40_004392 [Arthrobacter pascens]|uniref:hypothetical protein n=1 Tax=Arthrobacter pascens TaxID=1677 RepID=UPI0027836534|nr:hypothetical protein [Arthrobacter pascens]MDQ0636421.1 hypothetical protein [Arthrobacter pascens]